VGKILILSLLQVFVSESGTARSPKTTMQILQTQPAGKRLTTLVARFAPALEVISGDLTHNVRFSLPTADFLDMSICQMNPNQRKASFKSSPK
jgi:hypothetical protein